MIKYAKIDGYKNLGEVGVFSHLYQWVEDEDVLPTIILVNTEGETATVYKGKVLSKSEVFTNIPVKNEELKDLEKWVGKLKQLSFDEFIKGTVIEDGHENFVELKLEMMENDF